MQLRLRDGPLRGRGVHTTRTHGGPSLPTQEEFSNRDFAIEAWVCKAGPRFGLITG